MSEQMSSVEIEDVLSSIRRLVSDDLRPLHRPTPHPAAFRPLTADRIAQAVPPAPALTERLILTPALRVVPKVESPTKTVIAALEVAVKEQGEPWESETGDEAPSAAADTSAMGWIDALWNENAEQADRDKQDAVPEPLVLEMIRTSLPEETPEDTPAQPEVDSTADVLAEVEVAAEVEIEVAAQSWDQPADAEVEAPLAEPIEPETAPADPVWVARAEAEVLAALAEEPVAGPEVFTSRRTGLQDEDNNLDDITFDEEVLRDLVRDLIREELQGALGERITRNVRKLVRTELARAISAQIYE